MLDKARRAYGDPNMRFDTDDVLADRHLVFGDGTAVPQDGTLVYHDAGSGRTFVQNTDGSVSPWAGDGPPQPPIPVAGFRRGPDGMFAPIDSAGQQISPLVAAPDPRGHHEQNGVLTPTAARAGSATAGSERRRRRDGHQQGAGPAAVRRLQDELRRGYSRIGAAEEQLAQVLLDAHATAVDGRGQLAAIQSDLEAAVDNPANAIDTPAGQQAFLRFLRTQIAAVNSVVAAGALRAEDTRGDHRGHRRALRRRGGRACGADRPGRPGFRRPTRLPTPSNPAAAQPDPATSSRSW